MQKSFNRLVETYRAEILPDIVSGWSSLSEEDQKDVSRMNNFFCGLHYIVGLAEHACEALLEWEQLHFKEKVGAATLPAARERPRESGTIRLIKTATKSFHKHGDEQAGCIGSFHAFLESSNTALPLSDFRGNRAYVIFYNGAGVYCLQDCMLHFLADVNGETNRLLRAVKADLEVDEFVAGARALGLLCKFVVVPLWRKLEAQGQNKVSILGMSAVYTQLHQRLTEWTNDARPLLDGDARPYEEAEVTVVDDITSRLLTPAERYDALTQELLQVLCGVLAAFTCRLLADHLPGGQYHSFDNRLEREAATVANTNAVSERDFAQLDRLLRQKPRAHTVALEGMILFANNKMGACIGCLLRRRPRKL